MQGRIFILSPASTTGKKAGYLLRDGAGSDMARALRSPVGVPLGDVFVWLSGLYFRGKLEYARAFARPPEGAPGAVVVTTTRGLVPVDRRVRLHDLLELAAGDIDPHDPAYLTPLRSTAAQLADGLGETGEAVLLGSVASGKYVEPLLQTFGQRLLFPAAFVGRGNLSRGGLLLRACDAARELEYVPVAGAIRVGPRPPRLEPR